MDLNCWFQLCQKVAVIVSVTLYYCFAQHIETFSSPDIVHYAQILVEPSQSHLIIGARDSILRLETNSLAIGEQNIIKWTANAKAIEDCRYKGQSESLCRNYVRVLLGKNATSSPSSQPGGDLNSTALNRINGPLSSESVDIFVCGTNALRPVCSWRKSESLDKIESEEDASGKCPYNPSWNTTSLFTSKGIYFYFGPMDSQGHDNGVLRSKPSKSSTNKWARTIAADTRFINHDASFITSFEKDDFIYFIFRESAIEYMNCGKSIYSRIGRLCIGDKGERRSSGRYLTTFLKTRLNCSLPGQFPFYYDEIQSAFYTNGTIYAVFSTPENSIHGSAICAFTMASVEKAFDGPFKHQDTPGSMYKPEHNRDVAAQFSCNNSAALKMDSMRNQAKYQLMDGSVGTSSGRPLLIERSRLSRIVVDSISTLHYSQVNVMFVLTDETRLRRYVLWPGSSKACFLSSWDLNLPQNDSVLSMTMVPGAHSIYLGTIKMLKRVSMSNCNQMNTKDDCLGSGDPYCTWNGLEAICERFNNSLRDEAWLQNEDVTCHERTKLVDWSPWSDWRYCPRMININVTSDCLCRSRNCLTLGCLEPDDIQVINCTVNGGWTPWTPWTQCTTSCGTEGTKTRSRSCTNPTPQHGGSLCVGAAFERIHCLDNPPCSTTTTSTTTTTTSTTTRIPDISEDSDGWGPFGEWEECPVKCGGGIQFRRRTCSDPGGSRCPGCDREWRTCNTHECQLVKRTFETPWYRKNFSMDGSNVFEERFRFTCKAFNLAAETDLTLSSRLEERTTPLEWSECSVKCGKGVQFMYTGSIYLKRICDTKVDCVGWSPWSKWSSCVNGERFRVRSCNRKEKCEGSEEERFPCQTVTSDSSKGLNSLDDDEDKTNPLDSLGANDLSPSGKGSTELGSIDDPPVDGSFGLGGWVSSFGSPLMDSPIINNHIHQSTRWTTGSLIIFTSISFIMGTLVGTLITYILMRKSLLDSDDDSSKLSLKLFTPSYPPPSHHHNSLDKPSNPYVTADHFKISPNLNPSSVSTCLLNGIGGRSPSSLTSASSPMLNYSPIREATIKRASTIRAKLNSDQNF